MAHQICPFSGLPKPTCDHCKYPRGVHYEVRRGTYLSHPVLEILKNGGPIHHHDEHFRFGREKARLLLIALHVIRQFADVGDDIVSLFNAETLTDQTTGNLVTVWVELQPEFIHSSGETIERPWLQIQSANIRIGVGYEKAKAICAVANELRRWIDDPSR